MFGRSLEPKADEVNAPKGRVFKIISIGETKQRIYCSVYIY